ncbi:hypothetical protein [Ramlibacter sp.]|uniref:hypothetical protein n=1 Tax=Ramlibacter sp. TaxID=1917967 RepID=UPI002D473FEF|nr:hypothetical protein [Ramlibacter sp.]HYD77930.1 hypothetical protein [Ramlibacter sp.]
MNKLACMLLAALLGGCANNSITPNWDARFGDAVREARQRHTLNPAAGTDTRPVAVDGTAAREAVERYNNTLKEPPPVVNVINIGGAVGGSNGGGR